MIIGIRSIREIVVALAKFIRIFKNYHYQEAISYIKKEK